tara:strand:+ start:1561 stop:4242 length:2682 start_codon:yes stop_codon:yes gene_type:complete
VIIFKKKVKKKNVILKKKDIFFKYYFYLTISLFILLILLVSQTGYWNNYKKTFLDRLYKSSYNNYLNLPKIIPQIIYSYFVPIPKINIKLSFKNELVLKDDRKQVLNKKSGMSFEFKEVRAKLSFLEKDYNIDLRLKGDRKIHFDEIDKLSYKIELDNDNTIMGINKFSLMKPRARNYIHEWIYHKLMSEGNLITIKYDFINLYVNGRDHGLYVIEEGFDKILTERNKKRNGPIFSVKEEWLDKLSEDSSKNLLFETYNKKYWLSDNNKAITYEANSYLQSFLKNETETSEIFDLEKWSWFMAVTDLNYYAHGSLFKSVKFFYNPIAGKFEPIPFDGHRLVVDLKNEIFNGADYRNSMPTFMLALKCKKNINSCDNILPYKFFFNENGTLNIEFYNMYKKNLLKITSKKYLDKFFKKYKRDILKINSKIYGDYFYADNTHYFGPGLYYFNKEEFYLRGERLRFGISNIKENLLVTQKDHKIHVLNISENNTLMTNNNLVLKKLYCQNLLNNNELIIEVNELINKEETSFFLDDKKFKNIKCSKTLIVDSINQEQLLIDFDNLNISYNEKLLNIDENNLSYSEYFNINGKILTLKKETTYVNNHIFIPSGFNVKLFSGEEIILSNNSFIISESPFIADGGKNDKDLPIKIIGKKNEKGGGIFIKNTSEKNIFKNVILQNLYGNTQNQLLSKYIIYGSLNFFNTVAYLENVKITNIFSEDAINLVNTKFEIIDCNFDTISSDAIDVDNGNGIINKLSARFIANDALDFSESKVDISDLNFYDIGDKAISAGENSIVKVGNVSINKSYLGIVSKDGSNVYGENINNLNVIIPFAAYIKKNEYELPKLKVVNVKNVNFYKPYLKDKFGIINIDNINKTKTFKDILRVIYNPEFRIQQ